MLLRSPALVLVLLAITAGCGGDALKMEDYNTQPVTLPNGQIRAEVMRHPTDMARGMMFRDSLAPDRGMLFIHERPGLYPYWMYQVKVPLDIIWLDSNQRVVEISANTPPCKTEASRCPNYGGHKESQFVLELQGGMAEKYGVRVGSTLSF